MVKWLGLFKALDGYHANLVIGQRGAGKSSLLVRIALMKMKQGYKVFCNFPIDGAFEIPYIRIKGKTYLDKDFLYRIPNNSVIIIDECSTVWNNRQYGKWTEDDSEFFNFLRKRQQYLYLACQYYDTIDLNVKRALELVLYCSNGSIFPNVSFVSLDYQSLVKVEDATKKVLEKDMYCVTYMPCVLDMGTYRFNRRPSYGKYDTNFIALEREPVKLQECRQVGAPAAFAPAGANGADSERMPRLLPLSTYDVEAKIYYLLYILYYIKFI